MRKTCQVCRNYIREDAITLTVCQTCSAKLVPYKNKKRKLLLKNNEEIDKKER